MSNKQFIQQLNSRPSRVKKICQVCPQLMTWWTILTAELKVVIIRHNNYNSQPRLRSNHSQLSNHQRSRPKLSSSRTHQKATMQEISNTSHQRHPKNKNWLLSLNKMTRKKRSKRFSKREFSNQGNHQWLQRKNQWLQRKNQLLQRKIKSLRFNNNKWIKLSKI